MAAPPIENPDLIRSMGFVDTSKLAAEDLVVPACEWLTFSSLNGAGEPTIDQGQAVKFLSHMVRKLGLSAEDLICMRAFIERYQSGWSETKCCRPKATHGLQLILGVYTAQALQYDEPLARSVWLFYSKLEWSQFVDELFSFNAGLDFDIWISPSEYNAAYTSLTGIPIPASVAVRCLATERAQQARNQSASEIDDAAALKAIAHVQASAEAMRLHGPDDLDTAAMQAMNNVLLSPANVKHTPRQAARRLSAKGGLMKQLSGKRLSNTTGRHSSNKLPRPASPFAAVPT